ncbi:hypothetical protein DH2020_023558 [Rehmannia glutinosa]|uniref:HTH myb-type domain-containing protein n=1 Tax=Rehmannia glutinosa TaxID=99300 RepID=A0ABR0W7U1_REHGL
MAHKIRVLLVENDSNDHDRTKSMLQYFSYEVMSNDDDAVTIMRAIQHGVFLCIKKPVTMQILGYLWQHVVWERAGGFKQTEKSRMIIAYNTLQKESGEEYFIEGYNQNNNHNAEAHHKSKKKVNSETSQHDNVMFNKKVWTQWTEELHQKFMNAVKQLGEGRCYPKEILELMNVPGLTRMQVASHLQICRNAKWLPPSERKSKTSPKKKALRTKGVRFGSMPRLDMTNSQIQEFTMDPPTDHDQNNLLEYIVNHDNAYHPQLLLDHHAGNYPFAQNNETFNNMGQFGQTLAMNEPLFTINGSENYVTPNISSNQQRDINITHEDAFEFSNMDSILLNFSALQQELGINYDGSFQSIVADLVNDHNQWNHEVPKSANDKATQG